MKRAPDRTARSLLAGFQRVCAVLEAENDLLKAGRLRDVVEMLPKKQREMEALESILLVDGEDALPAEYTQVLMTPETEEAAGRFGALVRANRILLQGAIDAQNVLIRLIVVDATQEAGVGYGASGQYMANIGAQTALTLRSDV
ncbi:hypothetical protein ACLRDC_11765 [Gluconacetobacter sacchari]|uniref:FlgN protein n=2 Tax=Gluconacetobacter sacchari TaxID=92759 RepID=A0A7W4NQ10_9PROT|nr:hypothetical protein [Gluconacetobacter sacchari]MBB2158640.1 hypothetical protein [Gluconacetobacter sacchari]GBQ18868.1 hypothetical protein AA12717_0060 [Gluconacetobacter sacchari DSM 12717]